MSLHQLLDAGDPCQTPRSMGWVGYVIAWLLAALFWTLASASSSGRPPVQTLPYGLLIMADQTSCLTAQLVPDWFAVRLAQLGYDPMRYADLRHILWSSVPETRPAAKHRQEAARDMFRPRPANDS